MRLKLLHHRHSAIALLLFAFASCNHEPAPAAHVAGKPTASPAGKGPTDEDLRAARSALSIPDVVAQLRAGVPKEKVLAEVKQRHLTSIMVAANELELAANGAGHELLAALKDPHNLLSPAQETAYMKLVTQHPSAPTKSRR